MTRGTGSLNTVTIWECVRGTARYVRGRTNGEKTVVYTREKMVNDRTFRRK